MENLKIPKEGSDLGLMNIEQASEYLGLKKSAVYQMTMRRTIPFIKIGNRLRFKKSQLDSYINNNVVEIGDFD